MRPPAQCGTRAGYNAHRRKGEEPCESCRAACDSGWAPEEFARTRASVRALSRLAHLQAGLLRTLYLEELRREGIEATPDDQGDT